MSHAGNPFIYILLPVGFYCKESLVWIKTPVLCCTNDAGPSLGLFLDIALLPCVLAILQSWVHMTDTTPVPLPTLQQITGRVNIGVDQHITWFWAWIFAELISLSVLPILTTNVSSPTLPWQVHSFQSWGNKQLAGSVLWLSCPLSWFSHTYTFKASSTVLLSQGVVATLLRAAADQGQEQLRNIDFNVNYWLWFEWMRNLHFANTDKKSIYNIIVNIIQTR